MTRYVLTLLLLLPAAARAQLTLYIVNGTAETPAAASYNLGQVEVGDSATVRLRARNLTSAAVPITTLAISGAGFGISSPPTPPPNIAPGSFLDIYIRFSGGFPASYSANFQIDSASVLLIATAVPPLSLTATGGCAGPDAATDTIDFGSSQTGETRACTLSLRNPNQQPLTIHQLAVTGAAFHLGQSVPAPLILASGESLQFSIEFAPPSAAFYSGSLFVGARTYVLKGAGVNQSLPAIVLGFGEEAPQSGQQRALTMRLDAPSPIAASGSITLAFQPDTSAALAKDDPTVVFTATGARSVPFSIQTGGTQALLAGQPEAIFQTGTTAGTITFTVSSNAALSGDSSATLKIPPEPVVIDLAGAYAEAGALNLEIRGFDNTYSAGTMSFTFYDTAGRTIAGPIQASFTASFHDYFLSSQYGGAFQALVKFPVIGDASQAGSVDLQMTNAAGSTATQHLIFLDDAPQCEKLPDGLACSP